MKQFKRSIVSFSMLLALVVGQVALFAVPQPAQAQWAVTNPDLVGVESQKTVAEIIKENLKNAFVAAIGTTLMNTLFYAVGNVAQRSAVWVASGGAGEQPLYTREQANDFIAGTAAVATMSVYDSLSEEDILRNIDIDIDIPDNAAYLLGMRQGLRSAYIEPDFEFDFTDYADSYTAYLASVAASDMTAAEKTQAILGMSATSFAQNEFGNGLQLYSETLIDSQQKAESAAEQFYANGGFLDQVDPTSGYRDLPANFVRDQLYDDIKRAEDLPYTTFSNMFSGDNILLQLGVYGGQVFAGTLTSELMTRFQNGLFAGVAPSLSTNPFDPDSSTSFSRERAQQLFQGFTAFKPIQVTDYHMVTQLSTCATSRFGSSRPLFSCAMDTSFAAAVARAETGSPLTIEDAIDEGYINGGWPLIPATDTSRNQDDSCYTYGFCQGNLVKMRKARIISIGWELAVQSPQNSAENPVTLEEVVNGFHTCNADGERDDDNPWCHLIDPNWVLKAPESSCRTLAYGQLLQADGSDTRAQECVDLQTCIAEDEDGQCTGGFGYCVREENTWRFQGESCPEYYAGCLSFETRDDELVDYLTPTTDVEECGENEVGCQWYATTQYVADEEGNYDWPEVTDVEEAQTGNDAQERLAYFNAEAELCDASAAGCSEVFERGSLLGLNIIPNSSFELDEDGNGWPDGWLSEDWSGLSYDTDDEFARSGDSAVSTGSDDLYRYGLSLHQSRFYTLTFYARQEASGADSVTARFELSDANGESAIDLDGTSYSDDCSISDLDGDGSYETISLTGTPDSDDYERFECIFTSPTLSNQASMIDGLLTLTGSSVYVDDIQIEQNEDVSAFHVGYNATGSSQYVQLAPDYLGCTGSDEDPAACDEFAKICSANDVGCALYSPVNGDPAVSGVVSELDTCSESCVGYDTFKQEATRYEPNGEFPLYFIPDSAETCDEEAVGCDEFTNLETEEAEYFTYLRACASLDQADANTDGDQAAIFYTWEGSDEAGYQLRTWSLLESDLDGIAYKNYAYATSGEIDVDAGTAPCTHWVTTEDGISCTDDSDGDLKFDTDDEACDEHADILENPDCREFYDVDGDIHYRLWSEAVTVTNACASYRKTDVAGLGSDTDGNGTDDGEENCTDSGGYFDTATNICRFYGYSAESTLCADDEAGCRAFTGGRSNNSRVSFTDLFEDETLTNWETADASNVELSNESIATDGHSLKSSGEKFWSFQYDEVSECADEDGCASSGSNLGGECIVGEGDQYCGTLVNELFTNKTYTLSFWAKGTGEMDIGFDIEAGTTPTGEVYFEENLELTSDWKEYSLGPLDMNVVDYADFGEGTVLVFDPSSTATVWVDNVVLREGEDNITIIKDSWVTPATCDINLEGNASPQYQLGCQEYLDVDGDSTYLKSFSRLCDGEKVGCKAYYETHESESEFASIVNGICGNIGGAEATESTSCYLLTDAFATAYETDSPYLCTIATGDTSCQFDLEDDVIPVARLASEANLAHISYGPETVLVPADRDLYAIVGSDDTCNTGSAGCTAFGSPTLSFDQTVVDEWTDTYLIADPDTYDVTRCDNDDAWCEAFDAGEEGVYYFKDPGNSVCEYKTGVSIGGESYDGWFRDGTTEFCYGSGECSESGDSCTLDSECRVDSGTCSESGLSCSQDYDCGASEFCEDLSTEYCEVDDPSFLKSGVFSAMWQNGDDEYLGYTAACTPDADTCSSFEDPLAIDDDEFYGEEGLVGETFHFLNNSNLEDADILRSVSCKGQVSPSEGCVLFKDASDSALSYNASATYVASVHADELFGDQPFDLVDPVDCSDDRDRSITLSDGTEVDLCAQRCVYDRYDVIPGEDSDANGKIKEETVTGDDTVYDAEDIWVFGSSCYDDTDCVDYEGVTGDLAHGSCETEVRENDLFNANPTTEVPLLENDTNRVMNVSRDRVCSEWLACASSFTVWDEDLGEYREVCDSINLCTNYSESGDAFCSEWDPDDPAVVLDIERYTSRDVSWYGEEYSGYAIPDQFPVQHLSQLDIAPEKVCGSEDGELLSEIGCVEDTDCTASNGAAAWEQFCVDGPSDYRLAYDAGSPDSCSNPDTYSNRGDSCTVGYCSEGGSACTSDGQCNAGSCITGLCFAAGTDSCSVDSDCSSDSVCLGGFCAVADSDGAGCGLDFACADTTQVCVTSVAVKEGACFRGSCVLTANGAPFSDEESEVLVCRAQPESDSPFGNNIVAEWSYYDDSGNGELADPTSDVDTVEKNGFAYDTINGYENADLCAPGEDCVCAYTSVQSSLGHSLKIDFETDKDDIRDELADFFTERDGADLSNATLGICSGGSSNGNFCLINGPERENEYGCFAENAEPTTAIATCNPITAEDVLIGLEGYCLERDTGINLEGSPTEGACLTWYPVDQLLGASDLTAKYTEAGYYSDATEYCAYSAVYVDPIPSVAIPGSATLDGDGSDWSKTSATIACAERKTGTADSWDSCIDDNISDFACPPGHFMLMGEYHGDSKKADGGKADDAFMQVCRDSTDDDCPFVCVPETAVLEDGSLCREELVDDVYSASDYTYEDGAVSGSNGNGFWWDNDVYLFHDAYSFNEVAVAVQDCQAFGIEVNWSLSEKGSEFSTASGYREYLEGADLKGWYNYEQDNIDNYYLACKQSAVVDQGDFNDHAPFTNRLLDPNSSYTLEATDASFEYTNLTTEEPFGVTVPSDTLDSEGDAVPAKLAACLAVSEFSSSGTITNWLYTFTPPENITACKSGATDVGSVDRPESRSFADFEVVINYVTDTANGVTDKYSAIDTGSSFTSVWGGDSGGTASQISTTGLIDDLFARSFGGRIFEDGIYSIEDSDYFTFGDEWYKSGDPHMGEMNIEADIDNSGFSDWDWDERSGGTPPTIWSLDVNNCNGPYCREGTEGRMTVNSVDSGSLTAENGFYRTSLRFFAAAYKEQLPIRRVIVDWQDGGDVTGSPSTENFYKNHRGLKEDSLSTSLCDTSNEWGMTDDSCDPNYFTYAHNYFCSASILNDLSDGNGACTIGDDGYVNNAPCISSINGDDVCTFRPRIHIRDQWGWCTGVCESGTISDEDGDDGCYAGDAYGLEDTEQIFSECAYEYYPAIASDDTDPWVYYDGNIYVGAD